MTDPAAVSARARLDDDEFRAELRAFLREHAPARPGRAPGARLAWVREWWATLVDGGWGSASWPIEYGGMELPFAKQVIHTEELARAAVPSQPGTGVGIAGPTIIRHGTPDQRARWLRPMLRAELVWAQAYSEPDAGSDLPALRTTAVRDDDVYVVNGEKLWSTMGHLADRLFALVRTGPPGSRQHGITYLIIDAHAPGVRIRPIRDLTGGADFSEILFDDVRVPVADRVGEEDGGWAITRTSLGHERAAGALQSATRYRRVLGELIELAQGRGRAVEPAVRQQLAELVTLARILEYTGARTVQGILRNGEPGAGSSVARLATSTLEQRLHEVAVDLLGPYGQLARQDPEAVERGRWVWGLLRTRASTIGAGTAEIQRNTIGERVLGLPHEPDSAG